MLSCIAVKLDKVALLECHIARRLLATENEDVRTLLDQIYDFLDRDKQFELDYGMITFDIEQCVPYHVCWCDIVSHFRPAWCCLPLDDWIFDILLLS